MCWGCSGGVLADGAEAFDPVDRAEHFCFGVVSNACEHTNSAAGFCWCLVDGDQLVDGAGQFGGDVAQCRDITVACSENSCGVVAKASEPV